MFTDNLYALPVGMEADKHTETHSQWLQLLLRLSLSELNFINTKPQSCHELMLLTGVRNMPRFPGNC